MHARTKWTSVIGGLVMLGGVAWADKPSAVPIDPTINCEVPDPLEMDYYIHSPVSDRPIRVELPQSNSVEEDREIDLPAVQTTGALQNACANTHGCGHLLYETPAGFPLEGEADEVTNVPVHVQTTESEDWSSKHTELPELTPNISHLEKCRRGIVDQRHLGLFEPFWDHQNPLTVPEARQFP